MRPGLIAGLLGGGFSAPGLPIWSAAVNAALRGESSTSIVFVGDSTTVGSGSLASNSSAGARPYCVPSVVANLLAAKGIQTSRNHFFGVGGTGGISGLTGYDSRISFATPSEWVTNGDVFGQYMLQQNNGYTSKLSFVPEESGFDTLRIWSYRPSTGYYGLRYYLDGAATQLGGISRANTDSDSVRATDISIPNTTTSIQVGGSPSSVTPMLLCGVECRKSSFRGVRIYNAGIAGYRSTQVSGQSSAFSTINALKLIAPSLTVINLALNDYGVTSQASYTSAIQSIIDAAKLSGDVLLVMPNPIGSANQTYASAFRGYLGSLASANNAPLFDINSRWGGTYAAASASGYMGTYGDLIHPVAAGYADVGAGIVGLIAP